VVYTDPGERGGQAAEEKLGRALRAVALGLTLRAATRDHDVAFSTLRAAWVEMGGAAGTDAWKAFVASFPKPAPPLPARTAPESPLGARLLRSASRYGDGVPYGQKGPWGMYREGLKEMTKRIDDGKLTAQQASELLAAEGVYASARSLAEKARVSAGKSPVKGGRQRLLTAETEDRIRSQIAFLRAHDIPVTKSTVMVFANDIILETGECKLFKGGVVSNDWYYPFLDHYDMHKGESQPLESERDLWLTSTVLSPARAPLLRRHLTDSHASLRRTPSVSTPSGSASRCATAWQSGTQTSTRPKHMMNPSSGPRMVWRGCALWMRLMCARIRRSVARARSCARSARRRLEAAVGMPT